MTVRPQQKPLFEAAWQAVEAWFAARGWESFPFQRECWRAYLDGESGLIHSTTGTGKTLAACLGPMIEALAAGEGKRRRAKVRLLWVTPLRALAADTERSMQAAVDGLGLPWLVETRTGDTAAPTRARQSRRLPEALITTPESLTLLLSRSEPQVFFEQLACVVVDEWHELLSGKRGVQTELALARLRNWKPQLPTWGLSATLGNLETARSVLLGPRAPGRLVHGRIEKRVQIDSLLPETIDRFPWAGHLGLKLLPAVLSELERTRSALVFTNTRSQTEAWYQAILDARPEWSGEIALHHGSLDPKTRRWVESGLRDGRLRCVVCTSSLDLGVDFTPVERVLQVGSPKGVARLLQRAGRSGHRPGAASRVTCVPTHAFELVEAAAAREAAERGCIEARQPVEQPLDVLVQHAVTVALGGGFNSEELLREVRSTHSYERLSRDQWEWVLDFVVRGGETLRAYPEYRRVAVEDGRYVVSEPKIARRHRLSIGTITADGALAVQHLNGGRIGSIEETFASRLKPGDRFIFGGKTLEFVRLRDMTIWVRKIRGREGFVPRWMGGKMPLSSELASAVRRKLEEARSGLYRGPEMEAVRPILELQQRWSRLPAQDELLVERCKTREGHHLFFYPFEGRQVHEGLAALLAYRLASVRPTTFSMAVNDYGIELLSPAPAPLEEALASGLFHPRDLRDEILASLNAAEMAKRQFREIARVAGLVFQGFPGAAKSLKQLQVSSGLLFDVFSKFDPGNLLLQQAQEEVLDRQLDQSRLLRALERIQSGAVIVENLRRPTPLAFPLLVDRLREHLSTETLGDRVRRLQLSLEKAAEG